MIETELVEPRGAGITIMKIHSCLFLIFLSTYLKAHLLRATLSVKFLLTVVEVLALEAATRQRAVLAKNDILGSLPGCLQI